ncbi:hypothetical protein J7L05_07310 [bacterium]|nr:hypothetical protein [bacterium]
MKDSFDVVLRLCIESLNEINNCYVFKKDVANGLILARTDISWKTLGERIEIKLEKHNSDLVEVIISSAPLRINSFSHIDYGKNHENTDIIYSYLNERRKKDKIK